MAKFVYVTNGMASTLNSSFELSRRLVAAGHEVVYLSHLDLSVRVEAECHRFIQLTSNDRIRQEFAARLKTAGAKWSPRRFISAITWGRHYRQRSLNSSEIEEAIAKLQPDMLIIDVEMHYSIIALINSGIPIVLPIVWFSIFRRPSLPPLHTDLMPTQKKEIRAAWQKLLWQRRWSHFVNHFRFQQLKKRFQPIGYETNQRRDLKALASVRKVDFAGETDWTQWLRPHLYPKLTVLCLNAWEMEFPHNPPANIRYVGPMVHEHRQEAAVTREAQVQWNSFRDQCKRENKPIVYCSLGTFWSSDVEFLRKVVKVFEARTDWALVIGLGGKLTGEHLHPLPDNVLAMDFAPQLQILQASKVAITHGGITTINECVSFEVPLLVCSSGHVDQDGCAARVGHYRLGRIANIKSDTPQQLESHLQCLMSDSSIRENVCRMKRKFEKYRENQVAEKLLEDMIN